MNCKFFIFLIVSVFCFKNNYAQEETITTLNFIPKFEASNFILNDSTYFIKNGDSIQLKSLKFYISNIELVNGDKVVWQQKNSFHLIDASKNESLQIPLKHQSNLNFTKIKFNLGIDSVVNVSGALGGDLDPTKGMYWTWQSGYINFKLEGKSKKCKTRNNEFHFHLGGYQTPYSALQSISGIVVNKEKIDFVFDLEKFIDEINLSTQNKIMSPSAEAVLLSKKLVGFFTLQKE